MYDEDDDENDDEDDEDDCHEVRRYDELAKILAAELCVVMAMGEMITITI
jgi:hypothetical protein